MTDREKVIEELMQLHGSKETMNIISNAITLLKEQEPKNVLSMEHNRYFPGYYDLTGNCPGCHKYIEQLTNRHYCGYCGKGLIWDE